MEEIVGILFALYVVISSIVAYVKQAKKREEQGEMTEWPQEMGPLFPEIEEERKTPTVSPEKSLPEEKEKHPVLSVEEVPGDEIVYGIEISEDEHDAVTTPETSVPDAWLADLVDDSVQSGKRSNRSKRRRGAAMYLPLNKSAVRRSIVMAEILGPPVALREHRHQLYRSRR